MLGKIKNVGENFLIVGDFMQMLIKCWGYFIYIKYLKRRK